MTPTFLGLNKCSRCGGADPNCFVCGLPQEQVVFPPHDPEVDSDDSDDNDEPNAENENNQ